MLTAAALCSFTVLILLASAGARTSRRPVAASHPTTSRATVAWARHRRGVLVAGGVAGSLLVLGPLMTVTIGSGFLLWPRLRTVLRRRRQRAAIDAALPDAIEMLILVVRAGMTPHQAVALLTARAPRPIRPAFAEVERRRARGATLAEALHALPDLIGPTAYVVADTLAMAERYGTPIADALEQLSVDVRERRARRAEADARKLPIRLSFPLVVCTLPSFVLIAIVPAVLGALASLDGTGL